MRRGLPNMGNSKKVWAFVQCIDCGMRTQTLYPQAEETQKALTQRAADRWNEAMKHGD